MTTTVLASTTETKRRKPLTAIDMVTSPAQAQARAPRGTGREKGKGKRGTRLSMTQERGEEGNESAKSGDRKRKAGFDEDVEGFQFTRVKSKKARPSADTIPKVDPMAENSGPQASPKRGRPRKKPLGTGHDGTADTPGQSPDMVFKKSTRGNAKATFTERDTTPESPRRTRKQDQPETLSVEKKRKKGRPAKAKPEERNGYVSPEPEQSGTAKIALPTADTPVIQRNKDMRTNKSEKGSRRSSLTMRGRRASSLIDSGASNALPHKEVDTADFYKHIASDLPEPRRMRQLLTWCATRAMGNRPSGSRSEDESARLAARVIQEEILKDFSTNSQLSDWFGREDANPPTIVVKKPNPKNIQNTDKIKELEEQIQRLQRERHSLNALLRPPSIPSIKPQSAPSSEEHTALPQSESSGRLTRSEPEMIDTSLLDPSQQAILATIKSGARHPEQESPASALLPLPPSAVSSRLSRITASLAPTLDTFAAGIHSIDLYRAMADTVSSRVLRICSERLEERDAREALRRLALDGNEEEKDPRLRPEMPREDLGVILGALSRVERR